MGFRARGVACRKPRPWTGGAVFNMEIKSIRCLEHRTGLGTKRAANREQGRPKGDASEGRVQRRYGVRSTGPRQGPAKLSSYARGPLQVILELKEWYGSPFLISARQRYTTKNQQILPYFPGSSPPLAETWKAQGDLLRKDTPLPISQVYVVIGKTGPP